MVPHKQVQEVTVGFSLLAIRYALLALSQPETPLRRLFLRVLGWSSPRGYFR